METKATQAAEAAGFKKIDIKDLTENTFKLFHDDWLALTAGNKDKFNSLTIAWGSIGCLWQEPTVTVYVRPDRYTYQFMESSKYYTVCAFEEKDRKILDYLGSHSGRDGDKIKAAGLTPLTTENGNRYFKEARLVIECEKIYSDDLVFDRILLDKGKEIYAKNAEQVPCHRMYIGKILNVWKKK